MPRRKDANPRRSNDGKSTGRQKHPSTVFIGGKRFLISRKILKEVRLMQTQTKLLIPKSRFARLVREIMQDCSDKRDLRIQSLAMMALQEATEMYIVHFLEDGCRCSAHAKRITLMAPDVRLVKTLRSGFGQI